LIVKDVAVAAVPTPVYVPLSVAALVPELKVTLGAYDVAAVFIVAYDEIVDAACAVVTSSPRVPLDLSVDAFCADVTSSPSTDDDESVDAAFGDERSRPSADDATVDPDCGLVTSRPSVADE
jgi:hypothetical protein